VAGGYEDKEKHRVSSDSLVASSAAQRLVLAFLAEKQWIPNSWYFTTAFLQGKFLTRDVFFVPPIDFVGSHVFLAFEEAYLWHRVGSEVLVRSANRSLSGIWIDHSHYRRRPPYHDEW
jgi:hypothetical protein